MKFMMISLIIALLAATVIFVGIPLYRAWSSTSDCLYNPTVVNLGSDQHEEWFPCGYEFSVMHQGKDGGNPPFPCECDHSEYSVRIKIRDAYPPYTVYVDTTCGTGGDVIRCDNADAIQWCLLAHVPQGSYEYKFICSEGEETNWRLFSNTQEVCPKQDSWEILRYCAQDE